MKNISHQKDPATKYQIGYHTYAFGSVNKDTDIYPLYVSPRQMELELYYRGISDPNAYVRELPSFEWQKQMLYWFTTLSWDEKMIVNSYKSYGYTQANEKLREYPESEAIMNDIIAKAPSLPNDIVVYRYVTCNFPPTTDGAYKHAGYLSTSYLASFVLKDCVENMRYIRFVVPKGFKCIFIPGWEYELIFPHNIEIKIFGIRDIQVKCEDEKNEITSLLYEAMMLSEPF